jgi:hypothetical protein
VSTAGGGGVRSGRPWVIAAAVLIVVVLALVGWSVYRSANSGGDAAASVTTTTPAVQLQSGVPTALSGAQLKDLAASTRTPIYWAGAKAKTTYEVTRTADGSIYVRYLPAGTKVGSKSADYLTVATYLQSGAYTYLQNARGQKGVTTTTTQSGALVAQYVKYPHSAYFSFPNANYQVEVYSPVSSQSLPLVLDGSIQPVK